LNLKVAWLIFGSISGALSENKYFEQRNLSKQNEQKKA